MNIAVVVMAGGKGTRMKSTLPKVLHKVANREMVLHALDATQKAFPQKIVVITGHCTEQVCEVIQSQEAYSNADCILQKEQLGTGHAVLQTEKSLKDFTGDIVILSGDVPLINSDLVVGLVNAHTEQKNAITIMTAFAEDPTGLGRIIRDENDEIIANTEHKDATEEQRKIDEINTGIYVVKSELLFKLLAKVDNNNANKEYYLPDIIKLALSDNHENEALNNNSEPTNNGNLSKLKTSELVGSFTAPDAEALMGVNSRLQLSFAEDYYQNRRREQAMDNGVTLTDPQSVFFAYDTQIGQDIIIGPNVQFGAGVTIEDNVSIEGNCYFENTLVKKDAQILSFCHFNGAEVGEACTIGPFARLRPQAVLAKDVHIGNFVEIKKSQIGEGTKVGHLTYIGDAKVGSGVNFGAGTVVANYHSIRKTKKTTTIEDNSSIGANNTLIAPVQIGKGAFTGGGSVITKDVPNDALALTRSEQIIKNNYLKEAK